MKNIFKYIFVGMVAVSAAGCGDMLDTYPSSSVSGDQLLNSAKNALIPLNGTIRAFYTPGVSNAANTHQCFGISAYNLMADVMGEDCIMSGPGSGWFWYDCIYKVKDKYASTGWRPYEAWNGYYKWISNVNYIIASEETMTGADKDKNYVVGQAYAIRAYSYFMLAQTFARTYKGHETDPGVPVYTEPTDIKTDGKTRGTVQDVYNQITSDLTKAVEMLRNAGGRTVMSHIDLYTVLGIQARVALVMEDWATAKAAAEEIIKDGGYKIGGEAEILNGMNDVSLNNVIWGAAISTDQASGYAGFFTHMDADQKAYGESARKQINKQLYALMKDGDIRKWNKDTQKGWWNPEDFNNKAGGYQQEKFKFKDGALWTGDYIWMRIEEMYLTAAEANCRIPGNEELAKQQLSTFLFARNSEYYKDDNNDGIADAIADLSGTELGKLTTDRTGSLLEAIIDQRRIELWGEFGRIYDIRRLRQGFKRDVANMGWPQGAVSIGKTDNPESYAWVLTLPQSEFDGNPSLDQSKDQNPLGDEK